MSTRLLLGLVLLVAAVFSGWSVWKHRPVERVKTADARSDYVLQDFTVVVLDKQGREAFTLEAPRLARHPGDRTMTIATPVFHVPVAPAKGQAPTREAGWVVRAKTDAPATVELVPVAVHGHRNDDVLLSGPRAGELVVTAGVQKMAHGLRVALPGAAAVADNSKVAAL